MKGKIKPTILKEFNPVRKVKTARLDKKTERCPYCKGRGKITRYFDRYTGKEVFLIG